MPHFTVLALLVVVGVGCWVNTTKPGIGRYATDAVVNNDPLKVLGVALVGSIVIIVANLVVCLRYGAVDPRVRH